MTAVPDSNLVLCLNAGSSTLKYAFFDLRSGEKRLAHGVVEGTDYGAALEAAFAKLAGEGAGKPGIVGHRVVHGGVKHTKPALVDDALLADLKALVPVAPLHLPASIAAMEATRKRFPELPQVACFDTAFHQSMPLVAKRLPIPEELDADGVRRFGFHGLSYEYIMSVLRPAPPSRVVIAHLGNGASLVAVKDGAAIDTTMGFTPTGGILMGTRSGDLDPGLLLYLMRERGYSVSSLENLVEHRAGLVAVGGDSDVKRLLERAPNDDRARLALDMFGYAVKKTIGAYAAALGGLDVLVFTGGIGEHAAEVRERACQGLGFLGISLSDAKNRRHEPLVSDGACPVRVVATDEELVIARHAHAVIAG